MVHQVAGVPCANIDLKEWVKKERVGHEDPSEMEQGTNAANTVGGRACLICVLCLSCLESHPFAILLCVIMKMMVATIRSFNTALSFLHEPVMADNNNHQLSI